MAAGWRSTLLNLVSNGSRRDLGYIQGGRFDPMHPNRLSLNVAVPPSGMAYEHPSILH